MRRPGQLLLATLLASACQRHPTRETLHVNAAPSSSHGAPTATAAPSVTAPSNALAASSSPSGAPPPDVPGPELEGERLARRKKAGAGLPRAELDALERAAQSFFDARESSEVALSGTLPGALRLQERARLEDALVVALERARAPAFPPDQTGDSRAIEAEHDSVYLRLVTCQQIAVTEATVPGAVTLNGIRNTERLWISYRDAWIALGTRARPGTSPDLWRGWVTRERTAMLRELATGC